MTATRLFDSDEVTLTKSGAAIIDKYKVTGIPSVAVEDSDLPEIDDRHPVFRRAKVTQIKGKVFSAAKGVTPAFSNVSVTYTTEEFTGTNAVEPEFKFRIEIGSQGITEKFARRFTDKFQRGVASSSTLVTTVDEATGTETTIGTMTDNAGIFKESVPGMVIGKVGITGNVGDRGIVTDVNLTSNTITYTSITGEVVPDFSTIGGVYELNSVASIGPQNEGASVLKPSVTVIASKRTNAKLDQTLLAELVGDVSDGVKEFLGTTTPGLYQFISATSEQIGEDSEGVEQIWDNTWVFRAHRDGFQHRWFEVNANGSPISGEIISIIYEESDLTETGVA